MKMMKVKPGDEIYILLNGKPVLTVIDEYGIQRFPENKCVTYLVNTGRINLNDLARAFYVGRFDLKSYEKFYMDLGYSVAGFEEIFGEGSNWVNQGIPPVEIVNPLWQ